jgi:Ni/Fe-hydrogenase subunit HybB-like protein
MTDTAVLSDAPRKGASMSSAAVLSDAPDEGNRAVSSTAPYAGGRTPVALLVAGGVLTLAGVIAASALFTQGHAAFNTHSSGVTWGLMISAYVFFALASTGLTFVASLAMVFGLKDFYPIAKRCVWLALATIIAGFVCLGLELGNPMRAMWAAPISMQVQSPIFWMGNFYALYMGLLVLKLFFLYRNDWDSTLSHMVGIASFVTAIVAYGTLGSVFSMMAMRPFWYGPFVPIHFLVSAALSGVAFAVLFAYVAQSVGAANMTAGMRRLMTDVLPKLFALLLGIVLVFSVVRLFNGLWTNNPEVATVMWYQIGTVWFHIGLWGGLVVPFILMLMPGLRGQKNVQLLASALVLIGVFIGRYEYVVGGQQVPMFKGTWGAELIAYTPSVTEWGVVLLGAGIGLLIYAVAEWIFRLDDVPGTG